MIMYFSITTTYRKRAEKNLGLSKVWDLTEREISHLVKDSLLVLQSEEFLRMKSEHIAWGSQSLLEFQDLQSILLPKKGPFLNVNFLFYQGLSTLRESIVAGLNGLYHPSFSSLRSALEQFIFHVWWKIRLKKNEDYREFYDWLSGDKQSVSFGDAIREVYDKSDLPSQSSSISDCKEVYKQLCSYSHKPHIHESITTLRGTNATEISISVMNYWIELLELTLVSILDLSIANNPQCLFPVSIYEKFGFNPPIGLFFDHSNFVSIREWLGPKLTNAYILHYKNQTKLKELFEWYENRKNMTDQEILESWNDSWDPDDFDLPSEERIIVRWTVIKTELRIFSMAFAFGLKKHSLIMKDHEAEVYYLKDHSI